MIRGQRRPLHEVERQYKAKAEMNIHNRFDIEVSRSGQVVQRAYAENIVLNQLWTRLLSPNSYFNNIHFGTGTGEQSPTRTGLFSFLGQKAAIEPTFEMDEENGVASCRKKIILSETEFVGQELTEVGIGYGTVSTTLCTHALLKDMNGNQISIVKTNLDIITIYATVFVHWNVAGYGNGAIEIVATKKNFFLSHYLTGDYYQYGIGYLGNYRSLPDHLFFTPGGITGFASNHEGILGYSGQAFMKSVPPTFSVIEKKIKYNMRLSVAEANFGIQCIYAGIYFSISWTASSNVSNYIPIFCCKLGGNFYLHTTITGEAVGTGDGERVDFKTAFGFVKSGAKIYVDGVEQQTGVTVDMDQPPAPTELGQYFQLVESKATHDTRAYIYPSFCATSITDRESRPADTFYNPNHQFGVKSLYTNNMVTVFVSDDRVNWESFSANKSGTLSVPEEHWNKKYWRKSEEVSGDINALTTDTFTEYNIHFETPPPAGAVITADYTTATIAKDENHVFDFSLEIQLGERTE